MEKNKENYYIQTNKQQNNVNDAVNFQCSNECSEQKERGENRER